MVSSGFGNVNVLGSVISLVRFGHPEAEQQMSKRFHSASEVATQLGCHPSTLRRLVRLGRIHAELAGNTYVFDEAAIEVARGLVTSTRQRRNDYPELGAANTEDFLSVREVATVLGLTERQIFRLLTGGALHGWRWKGLVLVERKAVEALSLARAGSGRRAGVAGEHGAEVLQ